MNGYEPVDNTPVEIPTRLRLPQTRTDQIRQFIREEISRAAHNQGIETLEESDDIEPDDEDAMPYSRYELQNLEPFEPPAKPQEAVGLAPADPAPISERSASLQPAPAPNVTE